MYSNKNHLLINVLILPIPLALTLVSAILTLLDTLKTDSLFPTLLSIICIVAWIGVAIISYLVKTNFSIIFSTLLWSVDLLVYTIILAFGIDSFHSFFCTLFNVLCLPTYAIYPIFSKVHGVIFVIMIYLISALIIGFNLLILLKMLKSKSKNDR